MEKKYHLNGEQMMGMPKFARINMDLKTILNEKHANIVITTHHKPDADAMGSTLGLYNFLKMNNIPSKVISPTDYAHFLHFLPGDDLVLNYERSKKEAAQCVADADIIFCLDFNALHRINDLGDLVGKSKAKIVLIDHHQDPMDFADFEMVDTKASSTCELIYRFILNSGQKEKIDADIATCLFAGLIGDTGSFKFNSTTPKVHEMAAHLHSTGMDHTKVFEQLYDNFSLRRTQFIGFVISQKLEVFPEYNTALIHVTAEELKQYDVRTGDTEGLVNYGLSIAGVKFAALFIDRTVLVKISFRSKGDFPCNKFSSENFDGGGHINASGGKWDHDLISGLEKFKSLLPKYKHLLIEDE